MASREQKKLGIQPDKEVVQHTHIPLLNQYSEIKTPPMRAEARKTAGYNIRKLQNGELLAMPTSRPMPLIADDCHELRVDDHEANIRWCIIYFIDNLAIVILEIFQKKNSYDSGFSEEKLSRTTHPLSQCKRREMKDLDAQIKARLEAAGFKETNVQELFGLTPEENELIETRIVLSQLIKRLRQNARVTQAAVAKRNGSNQASIARDETNDPSVSVELMLKVVFTLGANRRQVANALCA